MTLTADAINRVVTKAGGAVLVTEYMPDSPVRVINTGTDRVYLGTYSGVSNQTGVPCEAGASVQWTRGGELWAVMDPAAVGSSATVLVTDCIASWEPSPVTVGVQVATAIAASQLATLIGGQVSTQANALGIPPTYFGAVAYDAQLAGGVAKVPIVIPFDFSGAASIAVYVTGISSACVFQYDWIDTTTGNAYVSRQIQASAAGSKVQFSSSVRSPTLQLTFSALNTLNPPRVRIYVSNHSIPDDSVSGDLTYTAGGGFSIAALGANPMPGNFLSKGGPHTFRAVWSTSYDTATSKSRMGCRAYFPDGTFISQWFCDGTFSTVLGTLSQQVGTVQLPPGSLQLYFQPFAVGAGSIFLDLWSGTA